MQFKADARKPRAKVHAFDNGVSVCRLWASGDARLGEAGLMLRAVCATCWAGLDVDGRRAMNAAMAGDAKIEALSAGGRSLSAHLFVADQPASLCQRIAREGCSPAPELPVCGRCAAAAVRVGG